MSGKPGKKITFKIKIKKYPIKKTKEMKTHTQITDGKHEKSGRENFENSRGTIFYHFHLTLNPICNSQSSENFGYIFIRHIIF